MKKMLSFICIFVIVISMLSGCQKAEAPYTENWESLIVDPSSNFAELGLVTYSNTEWKKIVTDAVSHFSLTYNEQTESYYPENSDFSISDWNKIHPFQYVRESNSDAYRYVIVYFKNNKAFFMYFKNNGTLKNAYELNIVAKSDFDKIEIGKTRLYDVCKEVDTSKKGYDGETKTTTHAEHGEFYTNHYVNDGHMYAIYYNIDYSLGADTIQKALVVSAAIKGNVY